MPSSGPYIRHATVAPAPCSALLAFGGPSRGGKSGGGGAGTAAPARAAAVPSADDRRAVAAPAAGGGGGKRALGFATAVDAEDLPGDVAGLLGYEERACGGNILGPAHP